MSRIRCATDALRLAYPRSRSDGIRVIRDEPSVTRKRIEGCTMGWRCPVEKAKHVAVCLMQIGPLC